MNLSNYKLYILDYDGFLVDSMPVWRNSASNYVKSLGYHPEPNFDSRIPLFTEVQSAETIKETFGLKESVPEILKDIARYTDEFYPKIPMKGSSLDILKKLKSMDKLIVVVSATSMKHITSNIKERGTKDYFTEVISVYNHPTLSKEDGSIFEVLMKKYGVEKKDMLLIDDSIKNLKGAEAFGIDAVGVVDVLNHVHENEIKEHSLGYYTVEEILTLFA